MLLLSELWELGAAVGVKGEVGGRVWAVGKGGVRVKLGVGVEGEL